MNDCQKNFLSRLIQNGIKHSSIPEDENVVLIDFKGQTIGNITIAFMFESMPPGSGSMSSSVSIRAFSLCNVPEAKILPICYLCSELNRSYRFCKFFIDEENELNASIDIYLTPLTAADICLQLSNGLVSIIDKAFPTVLELLKAQELPQQ